MDLKEFSEKFHELKAKNSWKKKFVTNVAKG